MADVVVAEGNVSSGRLTLVANVTTTVRFEDNIGAAAVYRVAGTEPVWFTTDGSEPEVDGQNSWPLIGEGFAYDDGRPTTNTPQGDVVKLKSVGTPTVIVTRA